MFNYLSYEEVLEFARFHNLNSNNSISIRDIEEFKKEKEISKDWEILSIVSKNGNNWSCNKNTFEWNLKYGGMLINQVKRLSDGEVFTVGDKIYSEIFPEYRSQKIDRFEMLNNDIRVIGSRPYSCNLSINIIQHDSKPKVPLFTTVDLKEVFEYDTYTIFKVDKDFQILRFAACDCGNYSDSKYFYSEVKAKEYILLNKPIEVSYQEIIDYCEERRKDKTWVYPVEVMIKDFFQSKINP